VAFKSELSIAKGWLPSCAFGRLRWAWESEKLYSGKRLGFGHITLKRHPAGSIMVACLVITGET
jgi:hypothetical protein